MERINFRRHEIVKHIILWKLKETLTEEEKVQAKKDIKENLEALEGQIDGLLKMNIRIEYLPSSSADIMMDSEFENEDALKAYQTHPKHQHVANTYVRPNVETRLSMDF